MWRIKGLFLSILAIMMLGGIASTSASAETEEPDCESNLIWQLCLLPAGSETLVVDEAGKLLFTSEAAASLLEVAGFVHIECNKTTNTGEFIQSKLLEANTTGRVTILFKECKVLEPNQGCKVAEPIEVKNAKLSIGAEEAEEKLGMNMKPEVAGGEFTTINIKGEKCTLAGPAKITGEITCHLDEFLQDLKEHSLLCLPTDTGMFFSGKKAIFEINDDITLNLHELWSVDLV